MADDLGWGELEVFPGGSEHGRIATPKLNQFAAEGMQFLNAYAGYTVCAPSRTTLFTGRHSGMFPKYGLSGTSLHPGDAITITELLKDAGYQTALFGKSAPLSDPLQSGFDTFIGQVDQAKCRKQGFSIVSLISFDMYQERSRIQIMENQESNPFFMYVSYTVPHAGGWSDSNKEQGNPYN